MSKVYKIAKEHSGRVHEATGTLEQLIEYFGYTLKCGNSWNKKIKTNPTTINSLISNLNKSVNETQRGSWNPDYYYLVKE